MLTQNRELREERGRIAKQMEQLLSSDGGFKRPEDREKYNLLDAEQKKLKERIDLVERQDEIYRELRGQTGPPPMGQIGGIISPTEEHDRHYKRAFNEYIRRGRGELNVEDRAILRRDNSGFETRDMGTGGEAAYPGATSGFFVPVGFVRDVERAMKYFGPMLGGGEGMPTIMDTDNGAPMPYPTSNDTAIMGELIAENTQVGNQDVNMGMVMFGAYKFSSKLVKCSLEILEDSAFDLEAFLKTQFAERIGRAVNQYLTTGSGVNQPTGIITAALASCPTVTGVGSAANDGTGGANTIGSDDLIALEHAVDPVYRPGARYMMSDSVLKAIKLVKDKYGRPLWQIGVRAGEPDLINGYPYAINNNMDALQTAPSSPPAIKNSLIFGRLDKYVVRRVRQLSVVRMQERFIDYGQIAFLAFARYDGNLLDAGTHPVALLQNRY